MKNSIIDALNSRVLVLDGAMGTMIQKANLKTEDYGGPEYDGCPEYLVVSRPDVIEDIHSQYLEAGADIIETNTFGGTPLVLSEYGLQDKAEELNKTAVAIARKAADKYSTPEKPRFVAGSMGPTTKALSVTGGVTFDELAKDFEIQAQALIEAEVDYLLVETCQDTLNIKAAFVGIDSAFETLGKKIPVALSITVETSGTMLAGHGVEALLIAVEHKDLLYVGLNCATGPSQMEEHIRLMDKFCPTRTSAAPNAGMPDPDGGYSLSAELFEKEIRPYLEEGLLNIIGGCCGTGPEHIRRAAGIAATVKPRKETVAKRSSLSGIQPLTVDFAPVMVGERTNVIGSRLFKNLIADEKFEEATDIGKRQERSGAHIIDVCLGNPDRDEKTDMERFMFLLNRKVKAPIMIDSTSAEVIEAALKLCQGKAIINSVNLENGLKRFDDIVPLARKYGAALVVGCIDEDPVHSMALTRQRKLDIAVRSYELLTQKYGMRPEDLYFDPLVFPVASGDENYKDSAVETIEGVRLIKEKYPNVKSTLGLSNVSFGLPLAGREVLNSVFLQLNVEAGLDTAIVNAEKLLPYEQISEEHKELALDLLFQRTDDPITAFANAFRDKKTQMQTKSTADMPIEERLGMYIVDGARNGLAADLDEMLKTKTPLEIINGPLMDGMAIVGKRFNKNEMIVAEVLQSAETMRAAVSHLEQFMTSDQSAQKGTIVLATVKGDVHDIGKNLLDIILTNNGFKVIDIGIKCHSDVIRDACLEHKPDALGLSGLLVKSAHQMVETAAELKEAGITVPLMIGGAALSEKFVREKIAPAYGAPVFYSKDAMFGLGLANKIADGDLSNAAPVEETPEENPAAETESEQETVFVPELKDINFDCVPQEKVSQVFDAAKEFSVKDVLTRIDMERLTSRYLGVHKEMAKENVSARQEEILERLLELIGRVDNEGLIKLSGSFCAIQAKSDKDTIALIKNTDTVAQIRCVRRKDEPKIALSDFVSNKSDTLGLLMLSAGEGIEEQVEEYNSQGKYLDGYMLQAIAIEAAEALVECAVEKLAKFWKLPEEQQPLAAALGYPACPFMDDNLTIFNLLEVAKTSNIELTPNFMMKPQATISAMVFANPATEKLDLDNTDF